MELIPAGALVALHLSTDTSRPAVRRAGTLAGAPALVARAARGPARPALDGEGCGIDLREDAGSEVAFALLPGRGGAASPLLLSDAPASGLPDEGSQRCGALVVQRIGDLVAIGEPATLAAAAAVAAGTARALVDDAGLPARRSPPAA